MGEDGRPLICTPEEYGRGVQRVIDDGYDALKFDPFYINANRRRWHPPLALDKATMDLAEGRMAAVREAVGPDVDICVEVHGVLGVTSAIAMGRRLVQYRPFFYEEPVHALNVDAMLKVSRFRSPRASGSTRALAFGSTSRSRLWMSSSPTSAWRGG
jgi:galactonate dehydratase